MTDEPFSTNERAEALLGRRLSAEDETRGVVILDQPGELGYRCPRHPNDMEALQWSEYNAFLWCSLCNVDIPSCMCVPLDVEPDPKRPWHKGGLASAVDVFLNSISDAQGATR